MSNCPNCGAPITGPECEYCGTTFHVSKPKHCSHDDIHAMYETAERLLVSGVVTANEARELVGLPRI
jgi:rRNA maturation protein Nop10